MSAVAFICVLGVLIIVHEFGHFLVARLCGIRVEKFSIGFGPVIFGRKSGETEFCVSLLPLGGFVKLAGENPAESQGAAWEFCSKSLGQRTAVVMAGPFMNALLAYVLFFIIFWAGQPMLTAKVGKVLADTPAALAGIQEGDRVLSIDGNVVAYWEDVLREVHKNGQVLVFRVQRRDGVHQMSVTPRRKEARDPFGRMSYSYFVGVAPSQELVYVKNTFSQAIGLAAERVWTMTMMIFVSLWMMVTGALPLKDSMTGPIGILFMTQQAAQMGLLYLLYFMGSLSVSLFVLNLLPIPVLDGGHLLFIFIEKIKGSPLKNSVKDKMTQAGMVALLTLMVFVILQDFHRFSILENIKKLFTH